MISRLRHQQRFLALTTALLAATVAIVACLPARAGRPIAASRPAPAASLSGTPRVTDGDTLLLADTKIRIHGIDAPESAQWCTRAGRPWACGLEATVALANQIARRPVECRAIERDHYDRTVAECRVAGEDLGAWMVARGWALAYRQYSDRYAREEAAAKAARMGIWQGEFVEPWRWRHSEGAAKSEVREPPATSCRIKGNISSRGQRIYHLPGGRWYANTSVDAGAGERWFCTEKEARAAGWRASSQ